MNNIEKYLLFGMPKIAGWLDTIAAEFTVALSGIQTRAGLSGSVGEIGVHHGKYFITILLCSEPGTPSFAIDVFDEQDKNVDFSGHGDLKIFKDNVQHWCRDHAAVHIIKKSSLDVTPDEILQPCGRSRLVSIDGGHTAECIYNDLKLVEKILPEYGVVAIDDYFHPEWPDVSSGASRYFLEPESTLRPVFIAPNKVFAANPRWHEFYWNKMKLETPFSRGKQSVMFGHPVAIHPGIPQAPPLFVYARERLRQSWAGPYLLAAKRALVQRAVKPGGTGRAAADAGKPAP